MPLLRFFILVVNRIKKRKDTEISLKKNALIIFEVAVLITVAVIVCFVVKGDFSFKNKKAGTQIYTENSIVYKAGLTFAPTKEDKNNQKDEETVQIVTEAQGDKGNIPVTNKQNSSENILPDSSKWTTAQIITKATEAVNKTKAYSGNLTVAHNETFTADVTECTGGPVVASVVNLMIGWVVSPVDETLNYQNGKAVNSEGETVPIILPQKSNFTLSENGVKSASVQHSDNEYIIKINVVEESVGMYDVPKHNASSIGYLDVSGFDLSFLQVDSADIIYKGSSLELHINADGYVTYAKYNIPMNITGSAHSGGISGSAVFDGEQTETWVLNY